MNGGFYKLIHRRVPTTNHRNISKSCQKWTGPAVLSNNSPLSVLVQDRWVHCCCRQQPDRSWIRHSYQKICCSLPHSKTMLFPSSQIFVWPSFLGKVSALRLKRIKTREAKISKTYKQILEFFLNSFVFANFTWQLGAESLRSSLFAFRAWRESKKWSGLRARRVSKALGKTW